MAKDNTDPQRSRGVQLVPTPVLTCLLENFPPHPLTFESFSSFAFSASFFASFSGQPS